MTFMFIYILALLTYFIYMVMTCFDEQSKRKWRPSVSVGMLPLILLVVARGVCGTDTANYMDIISKINLTGNFKDIELGFLYIVKFLLFVLNDPLLICILIAIITTVVLLVASTYDDRALFVFIVCIVPFFYLDMTMNGLRYGLAFAFAMYSLSKFYQNNLLISVVLAIVSVLCHVSGLIVFLILTLLSDNKFELVKWIKLTSICSLVVLAQINMSNPTYDISSKYNLYQNYYSPSWYSSLVPLVISCLLLYVFYGSKKNNNEQSLILRKYQVILLISFTLLTFVVAKISYAGLRLQMIVLFTIFLMMQFRPSFSGFLDKDMKKRLFVIGCIGLTVFIKNIFVTQGQGLSPFAPYLINPYFMQLWTLT